MILMEEQMSFSSLSVASQVFCSEMPRASASEARTRRRRKKTKGDEDAKKRRLSAEQVKLLEMSFRDEKKLESGRKTRLAAELGLDGKQVAIWFQNRRVRHKNKQVKEAYAELKAAHDAAVAEKCHLESEVLKLKQKLLEAEEEIRKISPGTNAASGGNANSPSSSFSAVSLQPLGAGEFGRVEGGADFMCIHDYDYINYMMMEWANLYDV
ncbi:hypothetical protein Cni_G26425 [Canna indica]|uniref:Homeobox-leucine zipper protein n=1 Tax=Canna indica TaxID=4628 RepID=A0AAQ3L266_9LILI|nr:hypothetical protein Cni_G26425 [Canna indica]